MSGVLHPVGPEPAQVYWIRRVLVLASAVLVLVLVIAVVANLNSAASASGPEVVPAPVGSTSAPVTTAAVTPATATSGGSIPSFSPAATTTTPTTRSTSATGAKPSSSGKSSAAASGKASAKAPAKASPSSKATQVAVAACDPAQLRPTLTGKQSIKVKAKTNLDLSLINGSGKACRLTLNADNFTLTIYSGRDRIWSTADCTDLVKPTSVKIATEDAYEWRLVWDGRRSKKSCKTRPEVPKAGTYVATAQFKGADPVQLRMFLHK
jgi:hypothetical protein